MKEEEYFNLKAQRSVLIEVAKSYPGRTIENIIQNLDACIAYEDKRRAEKEAEDD